MHGPGHTPPPPHRPSQGVLITLRVIFVALAVLSCGLLAWVSLLRLALVTRRQLDWVLFGLGIVHFVVVLLLFGGTDSGVEGSTTRREDVGLWLLLMGVMASVGYYLTAEIRHFSSPPSLPYAQTTGYAQTTQTGYGYPGPQPFPPTPPAPSAPPRPHRFSSSPRPNSR